ncbi:hypothetical protein VFPPC_05800 [Pochonia chlamydosporia 170]|uniref:Uncharacterized protein n=1 Tax=Pochonia chlamydosporia 170 TaxID=1380566 RepID=A0A179FG89_METCM|nr:hypothetical protein VFPPC_05800 [Pochonia chlamydosporia 170]OAQ64542.1 hypothetical protein VFPPC_05800 [Pochonia chlamydosporia 170]
MQSSPVKSSRFGRPTVKLAVCKVAFPPKPTNHVRVPARNHDATTHRTAGAGLVLPPRPQGGISRPDPVYDQAKAKGEESSQD